MRMSPIWTFSDPGIERFMKWLMGRTDVEDALQRLDKLTQETRTTVAEHSAVIHGIKNGASRSAHLLKYSALRTFLLCCSTATARERLRSWLSPPNPSTNHDMACSAYHDGTATWFTHGSSFKEWKSSSSLLWVHGKRTVIPYICLFITIDILLAS
jgi:hypothetical protein